MPKITATNGRLARVRRLIAQVIVAVVAMTLLDTATACGSSASTAVATSDATSFFHKYLASNGRIVRFDQGSDTVSEGQAYGMLIAVGASDQDRFRRIWTWTRAHLQRTDQLLAWRWQNGAIMDAMPASDADIDTAVALLEAAQRFHDVAYRRAGIAIANAVLSQETVRASPGLLVVAGPWASTAPAVVNPGYLVKGTASYLARETGDGRWRAVASATVALDTHLLDTSLLPPDWAQLGAGQPADQVSPSGTPDGSVPARYGLDAARLVIRLASSCSPADRALAARYASRLGAPGAVGIRSLSGAATVDWRNPTTDIALYAARLVGGDTSGARAALHSAQVLDKRFPTYFGMAWIALRALLFGSDPMPSCR